MLHSSLSLSSLIILTALISLGTLADLTALVCCRDGAARSQGGISLQALDAWRPCVSCLLFHAS